MPESKKHSLLVQALSDKVTPIKVLSYAEAEQLFDFFKKNPLFKWSDVNNNCENRAEAISLLLGEWNIVHFKAWVVSGSLIRKGGSGYLANNWKYHVAAIVPVQEMNDVVYYVIDPATSGNLAMLADWAHSVTHEPFSYHLIKRGDQYIFKPGKIRKGKWYERSRQNYKWTMQGLSGINGLSSTGKAYLTFKKNKVQKTALKFDMLKKSRPIYFT
ncbi:MAG: protein-glutamine glutaminase family protein [Chitinophagaceae bacterium]